MTETSDETGQTDAQTGHGADRLAPVRDTLLDALLPLAAFDGWHAESLDRAAREAGIDTATRKQALPGGVVDLIDLFAQRCDAAMEAHMAGLDLPSMKIRVKITEAVRARIDAMTPHKAAAHAALQTLSGPSRGLAGPRLLVRTCDRIWRAIGDTSTDVNYYTKRTTLSAVYGSTALVYFDDLSENHAATWAFLDRRIADVMTFEKVKAQAKKTFNALPSPLAVLATLRYPDPRR